MTRESVPKSRAPAGRAFGAAVALAGLGLFAFYAVGAYTSSGIGIIEMDYTNQYWL